jgi:hypothetical protein
MRDGSSISWGCDQGSWLTGRFAALGRRPRRSVFMMFSPDKHCAGMVAAAHGEEYMLGQANPFLKR